MGETLLKFAETVIIDATLHDVLQALQPKQLGCGNPGGVQMVVRFVQGMVDSRIAEATASTEERANPGRS